MSQSKLLKRIAEYEGLFNSQPKKIIQQLIQLLLVLQFTEQWEYAIVWMGMIFLWDYFLINVIAYVLIPRVLNGWSYVNRQDDAVEVEYLRFFIAKSNAQWIWTLLILPLDSIFHIGFIPLLEVIVLGALFYFRSHKSYYQEPQFLWSIFLVPIVFILGDLSIYESSGLIFFILSLAVYFKPKNDYHLWIVQESYAQADQVYQKQYQSSINSGSISLSKINIHSLLRNAFQFKKSSVSLPLPSQSDFTIGIGLVGETKNSVKIDLVVDGKIALSKHSTALESSWNDFKIKGGEVLEFLIEGPCDEIVISVPQFINNSCDSKNIILIVCDALTKNDTKLYHPSGVETPHIQKFFTRGTQYYNAIVQGEWTTTNFAHMFSGLYSSQHGATNRYEALKNPIHQNEEMLAEYLQNKGYHTAMFSCSKRLSAEKGYARGFDEVKVRNYKTVGTEEITYQAIDWIDTYKNKPSFIVLHYMDTHGPFNFWSHFKNEFLNFSPKVISNIWRRSDPQLFDQVYQNQVKEFDLGIGVLFSYLENHHFMDNAAVLLTADHGQMHNIPKDDLVGQIEPLLSYRMLNVPLWLRTTEDIQFKENHQLIEAGVDLLPTILDLIGIESDNQTGQSYYNSTTSKTEIVTESFYEGIVQRRIETDSFIFYRKFSWLNHSIEKIMLFDKASLKEIHDENVLNSFLQFEKEKNLIGIKSDPLLYYGKCI